MGWAGDKDDMPLRFLMCAQQLSPALFEKHCTAILSDHLAGIMVIALAHQDTMRAFEGSILALSNLIDKAFEQALNRKVTPEAFKRFLSAGTALHATYQDRIIATLPQYLKLWPSDNREIIALLKSPIQLLRATTFQALTEYMTTPKSNERESSIIYSLGDIFLYDLNGIRVDESALDAYQYFYQACKKNDCIFGLQLLWIHLSKSDDQRTKLFLQFMIKEFFNLPTALSSADSFDTSLNKALIAARTEKRIPPNLLSAFLKLAMYTSLSEHIIPSFLEEYKIHRLLQEETPLEERCQLLNDLLSLRPRKEKGPGHIALKINGLPESRFKEYAKTIIATINPTQKLYDYFYHRKKLVAMHAENKEFDDYPDIIRSISPGYYNALLPETCEPDGATRVHRVVKRELALATLRGNLIFGYLANDGQLCSRDADFYYRFYACDSTDGYAVWASPIKLKEPRPFVVQEDAAYCVNDANEIVKFNKINGSVISVMTLPVKDTIEAMNVTADKTLFALYENQLSITNLQTNQCITYQLPSSVLTDLYHIIDNKLFFVMYHRERKECKFLVFDNNGREQTFELESSDLAFNRWQVIQGNHHMLWYSSDTDEKIIFLDFTSGKKLGEYKLPSKLQTAQLSKKGDKLFFLTNSLLIAWDLRKTSTRPPCMLWQTSICDSLFHSEITDIVLSDDDSTLYGIDEHLNGALLHFDSQTGAKQYLYPIALEKIVSPSYKMLGTHKGKLYIQPN